MGEFAFLRLGTFDFYETKDFVDDDVLALFREGDRRLVPPRSRHRKAGLEYATTARAMGERLDVMGFTLDGARQEFESWLAVERAERDLWEVESGILQEFRAKEIAGLANVTFDDWLRAFSTVRRRRLRVWEPRKHADEPWLLHRMLDLDRDHLWGFRTSDLRWVLRAAISTCRPTVEVRYDLTALVDWIDLDFNAPLAANAEEAKHQRFASDARVVVLTEGSTDARLLRDALQILAPHLFEFFSFLDLDKGQLGGASGLVNIAAAFSGASIANRVIALFDNDTAGHEGLLKLRRLRLGNSVRGATLPDLPLARRYPTLGPPSAQRPPTGERRSRRCGGRRPPRPHPSLGGEGRCAPRTATLRSPSATAG
jgi:hypothetical protein